MLTAPFGFLLNLMRHILADLSHLSHGDSRFGGSAEYDATHIPTAMLMSFHNSRFRVGY